MSDVKPVIEPVVGPSEPTPEPEQTSSTILMRAVTAGLCGGAFLAAFAVVVLSLLDQGQSPRPSGWLEAGTWSFLLIAVVCGALVGLVAALFATAVVLSLRNLAKPLWANGAIAALVAFGVTVGIGSLLGVPFSGTTSLICGVAAAAVAGLVSLNVLA